MNKREIKERIDLLNENMLLESAQKLVLLNISTDYTYNKGIAIISKNVEKADWYSTNDKTCYKTWNEIEAFIDGVCKCNYALKREEKDM